MLQSYNLILTLPKINTKKDTASSQRGISKNTKTMCLILTTITILNIVQILDTIIRYCPCKQDSDRKVGSYQSHPEG
jgi:hypothetical protein